MVGKTKTVMIVEDKYKVEVDALNHTLYEYDAGGHEVKVPKTGEIKIKQPSWNVVGYFPNIRQCLNRCVGLEMMSGGDNVTTMQGYLTKLTEVTNYIDGKFKNA